jgi:hypothetical protein
MNMTEPRASIIEKQVSQTSFIVSESGAITRIDRPDLSANDVDAVASTKLKCVDALALVMQNSALGG